jgi:hypothetical protein
MDEPRLHGTTLGLCRRRSPTEARRERGGGTAARVRAPPVSSLESDAGALSRLHEKKVYTVRMHTDLLWACIHIASL